MPALAYAPLIPSLHPRGGLGHFILLSSNQHSYAAPQHPYVSTRSYVQKHLPSHMPLILLLSQEKPVNVLSEDNRKHPRNMDPVTRRVPPDKRKRTEISCDKCKSRKQKCDKLIGQTTCRYCELRGIECSITHPRKKRLYGSVEGVGNRLALLESLVKGLLPEADLSSNDEMRQLGKSLGIPLPVLIEDVAGSMGGEKSESGRKQQDDESILPLLPDQQGQVQYIGPASSFSFHLKMRRLMGNYSSFEFAMFGKNAADQETGILGGLQSPQGQEQLTDERRPSYGPSDCNSPSDAVREIDGPILDALIDAYFDIVHSDFPVLHEASFRETYEIWSASDANSAANPVWLCGLLCVLILSRRVVQFAIPEEAEQKWWRHVQTLLPTVFFASNVFAVQALMLGALHLHNTNHRDACWNLTGTAIRIAFAIGLHRDDVKHIQSPLGRVSHLLLLSSSISHSKSISQISLCSHPTIGRSKLTRRSQQQELRKQLWWTLYAFEQMQVSSYDRPSAIEHTLTLVGCPNERIVGSHCPQDYLKYSQSLIILMGSATRILNLAGVGISTEEAYTKPLSPAASVLRDLRRWKEELPSHLSLQNIDSLAPSSRRPLILLHIQFHYTVILMSRSSLLRKATLLSKNTEEVLAQSTISISDTCIESGRALGGLINKLESINKFNPFTWWDIFYTVSSTLILMLDINCNIKQRSLSPVAESPVILGELVSLMAKQLEHPRVPGSMKKWVTVVMEVGRIADQMVSSYRSKRASVSSQVTRAAQSPTTIHASTEREIRNTFDTNAGGPNTLNQPPQGGAFSYESSVQLRDNAQQFWSQMSFMDDPNGQVHDWSWDDIDAILRGSSTQQQSSTNQKRG